MTTERWQVAGESKQASRRSYLVIEWVADSVVLFILIHGHEHAPSVERVGVSASEREGRSGAGVW